MGAEKDIFVVRVSSSTALFDRPATSLAEYKMGLLDHPKAGNQGFSSKTKLSQGRGISPRVSPTSSAYHLAPSAPSRGALGSAASIGKLDRSPRGSSHGLSIPVDTKHQKAIQEVAKKDGSFSVTSFIVIKKSVVQDIAVLERYDTSDEDGTLKFQLLSVKNAKAVKMPRVVDEARDIKYIFVSSLLCILPCADSMVCVLDYHASNLLQLLNQNHRRMHENGAKFYMAEILMGLDYLHEKNILYKDLNPENVLITETGHVKLVNPIIWNGINNVHGTPGCILSYLNVDMAPELIHNDLLSKASDIWSYGCLLFELLTGDTPFPRDIKDSIYTNMIIHGEAPPIKFPYGVSSSLIDFVNACLQVNVNQRLGSWKGCMDLKCHRWFKDIPRWSAVEETLLPVPMIPDIFYYDPENFTTENRLLSGPQIPEISHLYF